MKMVSVYIPGVITISFLISKTTLQGTLTGAQNAARSWLMVYALNVAARKRRIAQKIMKSL